jgi:hypothetical protein
MANIRNIGYISTNRFAVVGSFNIQGNSSNFFNGRFKNSYFSFAHLSIIL